MVNSRDMKIEQRAYEQSIPTAFQNVHNVNEGDIVRAKLSFESAPEDIIVQAEIVNVVRSHSIETFKDEPLIGFVVEEVLEGNIRGTVEVGERLLTFGIDRLQ